MLQKLFEWLQKSKLVELKDVDVSKDPVRPELTLEWRQQYGRKIYGLYDDKNELAAVMCFAFTHEVPKSVEELDILSKDAYNQSIHRAFVQGNIAIAYTVWSNKKGGGKKIVKEVYNMIKKSNHLNRLVTLSPLTDMATKFHKRNGAKLLQINKDTQNFEYEVIK
mgnify:CR=1 FL=1|tara:strand:+ start:823 stop:1317 length:495 start_codon:yes stop_codon:yes gene_type:complete